MKTVEFLNSANNYMVLTHPLGDAQLESTPRRMLTCWYDLLSSSEKQRAHTFRFDYLRRDFIVAHGLLRLLLAKVMQKSDPRCLRFISTARGKPILDPAVHVGAPGFSLSHSSAHLAIAVCMPGARVGIDIESSPPENHTELIDTVLSRAEYKAWRNAPIQAKALMFLRYWTRKEAYLKLTGQGLIDNLHAIDSAQRQILTNGFSTGCFVYTLELEETADMLTAEGTAIEKYPVLALASLEPSMSLSHVQFKAGSFIKAAPFTLI